MEHSILAEPMTAMRDKARFRYSHTKHVIDFELLISSI